MNKTRRRTARARRNERRWLHRYRTDPRLRQMVNLSVGIRRMNDTFDSIIQRVSFMCEGFRTSFDVMASWGTK